MARDFRPKDKKQGGGTKDKASRPQANGHAQQQPRDFRPKAAKPSGQQTRFGDDEERSSSSAIASGEVAPSAHSSDGDDGEEGTEEELREAIAALGGEEGDLDLISSKALKATKGKGKQDDGSEAGLGDELKAFMKGLNLPTDVVPQPAPGPSKSPAKEVGGPAKKMDDDAAAALQEPTPTDAARASRAADKERTKQEKKEERRRMAEAQKAAADENKRKASKVEEIAKKAKETAAKKKVEQKSNAVVEAAKASSKPTVKEATSQLLITPAPQWMGTDVEALGPSSSSASSSALSHDRVVSLLAEGNAVLSAENATYHSLLNSGSHSMTAALGGLTPSDAKFISSLLGDTSSISGSAGGGGTLSDRIAAHALLLGSSALHNLRSLDALVTMAGKKSREESGRATRALADWFAGAGLGSSGRKLRYFRDQPELAATAAAPSSRGKQQRLCLFAFEDRLKKTYFSFLQTLENQSHDPLPFVRQQAVSQTFILLREKSEQEQNLMRLLVNKLGDGEKSVASKATNNLLELLNVHPNMKAIVTREVGELIRKPTRSSTRADKETTKKHHNHAKYYGVLALNQIMLTRQDTEVANSLIQLYFELFEEALNDEAARPDADKADGEEGDQASGKKKKDRWRDKKGKKGGKGNNSQNPDHAAAAVAETEGKMMAAILTGVRRAFPFAQLETNVFDKHLDTLFRITHSSSFNIAVQALQLIYVVATSSSTSSTSLSDRFHSSLYSSMLDPRLAQTSKTAMYLNLCFKAMRDDVDEDRRAAEVKRLVQVLAHMDVEFVCGALFLIGELIRAQPRLRGMLTDPEDDDEEVVRDQPEDAEDDEEADHSKSQTASARPATAYDPRKRDPRFARARPTCLWEVRPLLSHHHPTVRLLTTQLIQGQTLTTTPDLTLYSLSHFLDRFVYRNAKKAGSGAQKGASGMQPAIAAAGSGEDGVRKVKGWSGVGAADEVNTEKFRKKKAEDVPVDSLFFHHFFNLKEKRDAAQGKKKGKGRGDEMDSDGGEAGDEDVDDDEVSSDAGSAINMLDDEEAEDEDVASDADSDASDDSEEREIWAAMKRTMPAEDGDAELMDDSGDEDEDDEDLAELDYTDSEEEAEEGEEADAGKAGKEDDVSSDEEGMFDEDEDDLLPFADFEDGEDSSGEDEGAAATTTNVAGKKRGRDDGEDEESKPKSKSQQRRAERKKRKAMPTFASAEDYAHLLGGGDDEE